MAASFDLPVRKAGYGLLRLSVFFSMAGIALALVLTPIAENASDRAIARRLEGRTFIDHLTTASVPTASGPIATIPKGTPVYDRSQIGGALVIERRSVLSDKAERFCLGERLSAC